MNIDRYITDIRQSDGGVYYKNPAPFDSIADDEILYVSEEGIEILNDNKSMGYDFTDDELVRLGFADTKQTIREDLQTEYPVLTDDDIDSNSLIQTIFDLCSWQHPSTVIAGLWEDDGFMELLETKS